MWLKWHWMFKFLLSVSLPPDYWSECWRQMWALQQCDSFTLGLPADPLAARTVATTQLVWLLKTMEKSSSPRRLLLSVNQTCAKHTHTDIQRHTLHTHTHAGFTVCLCFDKKMTFDQYKRMVTWFAIVCEFSGGRHVDRARSITHRQSCGQGHELSRLSGNHTNGRKKSICVSFTSALACDKSSPPNAGTTSAASVFLTRILKLAQSSKCGVVWIIIRCHFDSKWEGKCNFADVTASRAISNCFIRCSCLKKTVLYFSWGTSAWNSECFWLK